MVFNFRKSMSAKPAVLYHERWNALLSIPFWKTLMDKKLNEWQLGEVATDVVGYSSAAFPGRPPLVSFDSFSTTLSDEDSPTAPYSYVLPATIVNLNTPEEYVKVSNAAAADALSVSVTDYLTPVIADLVTSIRDGSFLNEPSKVATMFAVTYADLKRRTADFRVSAPTLALSDGSLLHAPRFTPLPKAVHDAMVEWSMGKAAGPVGRGRPLAFVATNLPSSLFSSTSSAPTTADAAGATFSPLSSLARSESGGVGVLLQPTSAVVIVDFSGRKDSTATPAQNIITALLTSPPTRSLRAAAESESGIRVVLLRERRGGAAAQDAEGAHPASESSSLCVTVRVLPRPAGAKAEAVDGDGFVVAPGWLNIRDTREVEAAAAARPTSYGGSVGDTAAAGGSVAEQGAGAEIVAGSTACSGPLTDRQQDGHVDLTSVMDASAMVTSAAELNLSLMTWQAAPSLDVGAMRALRVLLVGSGTLGCHVARQLIQWGVSRITFIDSGKVAPSNPVRQNLFCVDDVGKPKAAAAAGALARIYPPCATAAKGVQLMVPMPGHPVGPVGSTGGAAAVAAAQQLDELVRESDVVFMLTDSREARWLPTVAAAAHGKAAFSVALGFETWMVVRHAVPVSNATSGEEPAAAMGASDPSASPAATPDAASGSAAAGGEGGRGAPSTSWRDAAPRRTPTAAEEVHCSDLLGCYFCHDIAAPSNSMKDRTLDKACTVTRPAGSAIASATAVELCMALVQHPLGFAASATDGAHSSGAFMQDATQGAVSILGALPHMIRGSLASVGIASNFAQRSVRCPACSSAVTDAYKANLAEFVVQVCNDSDALNRVTGADKLMAEAEAAAAEILEFSDDDF